VPRVLAVAIGLIALAITTTTADAASTRAEYVAQVDPICQAAAKPEAKAYYGQVRANRKAYVQIQSGVPPKRAYRKYFPRAARFIARRSRVYSDETVRIAAVPPALGDEQVVGQWVQKRVESANLLNRAIVAAHHRNFSKMAGFEDFAGAAEANGENFVADFGFKYCTPIPSED
jgi:hypothetical protein